MTRRDILQTAHEPFGDAFYYGPERLSERFDDDEDARIKSGFSKSTYRTVMDRLRNDGADVRQLFVTYGLPFCAATTRTSLPYHSQTDTDPPTPKM